MVPKPEFFGSTVISDKGQVVIPSEARKALGLSKGDKLVVIGFNEDTIVLMKSAGIERMVAEMAAGAAMFGQIVESTKGQTDE